MWIRLIIIFAGIVLMINGCNSLISQFAGTHALRTFSVEEATADGIGDADFIELTDAWRPGKWVVGPALHKKDRDILLYPILSGDQYAAHQRGETVRPAFIAWGKNYDPPCLERGDCIPDGAFSARGLVREPNPEKDKSPELSQYGFELPEKVYYLEVDREPLAWYWNLLMFVGGIAMAIGIEAWARRQKTAVR